MNPTLTSLGKRLTEKFPFNKFTYNFFWDVASHPLLSFRSGSGSRLIRAKPRERICALVDSQVGSGHDAHDLPGLPLHGRAASRRVMGGARLPRVWGNLPARFR